MNYKNFSGLLAAAILFAVTEANAQTIKGEYVGCLTKSALDEFTTAAINKDFRQMEALLGKTCVAIKGREYSIVKSGFIKSQIRVYAGGSSVVLWVPSEATRS